MTDQHARFNQLVNSELEQEITGIIDELNLKEKVWMMSGHGFFEHFFGEDKKTFGQRAYRAGSEVERLDIPALMFSDGPRGVRHKRATTCYPVAMARGAAWDTDLERRIGEAIGIEARAIGVTLSGAVCVNLLRHPAWGRAQETYGEDSFLLGEMGAALCEGIQRHNVIATVKHFAVNSIENTRFEVNVQLSERTLREVYLPHFKRIIDAGCGSVMSAYNKVNGTYCGHNAHLLRDILKVEWGFQGFVHSDWIKGVYGPDAAAAGLDIENPEPLFFGEKLEAAVTAGEVTMLSIDDAVRRILRTQLTFSRAEDPRHYGVEDISCQAHIDLAREAAEKSFVLLKNEQLLPLNPARPQKIAVIGRLANTVNLGDRGSSRVTPPYAVTLWQGLIEYPLSDIDVVYDDGSDPSRAALLAASVDTVVVVAGYTWEEEGEYIPGNEAMEGLDSEEVMPSRGGDRASLNLPVSDELLIEQVCAANTQSVVAIMGGSAITMESWRHLPAAIVLLWYPGMEGGRAFARTLFGEVSPSGKLPFTIPVSPQQLPSFDATSLEVAYGLFHGYTLLDHTGETPAYPFGFGLSYTRFGYRETEVSVVDDETWEFRCEVVNEGDKAGAEVAQFYVGFCDSVVERPRQLLKGFQRVELEPGERRQLLFMLHRKDLAWYDERSSAWSVEEMRYSARIAGHSREGEERSCYFRLGSAPARSARGV